MDGLSGPMAHFSAAAGWSLQELREATGPGSGLESNLPLSQVSKSSPSEKQSYITYQIWDRSHMNTTSNNIIQTNPLTLLEAFLHLVPPRRFT